MYSHYWEAINGEISISKEPDVIATEFISNKYVKKICQHSHTHTCALTHTHAHYLDIIFTLLRSIK